MAVDGAQQTTSTAYYRGTDAVERIEHPDGSYVTYTYDDALRVKTETTPLGTRTVDRTALGAPLRDTRAWPNGVPHQAVSHTHDALGRVQSRTGVR